MSEEILIPEEVVISKIFEIRGEKVMLDRDLAELYGVETKVLKQSIKRNIERFPEDFMFQMTDEEFQNLRSQFATSSWGGSRYAPYCFTEQGVAMLSSVLNSQRAIDVNIRIIRTFTKMRSMLLTHKDLLLEMEEIKKKVSGQDEKIDLIFNYLQEFVNQREEPLEKIGFKTKK